MNKIQSFEEFVNERKEYEEGGLLSLKSTIAKIEDLTKDKSSEIKDFKKDFMKNLKDKTKGLSSKEKGIMAKIYKDLDKANSFTDLIDRVMSLKNKFGVKESFNLVLEKGDASVMKGFWNVFKKGAKLTWDKALKPLLKYLVNVLSRLTLGICYTIINALFATSYPTPDATIFKDRETSAAMKLA